MGLCRGHGPRIMRLYEAASGFSDTSRSIFPTYESLFAAPPVLVGSGYEGGLCQE
jgi:hypothetical protein